MQKIPEESKIAHFLVFFLIHSLQVGVGVFGFQRAVAEKSQNDAWMAVLFGGLFIHIIIFMMYRILENSNGDLISVHRNLFGKWVGHFLSCLFTLYFLMFTTTILRTYIEVVTVWIFNDINVWLLSLAILLLVYYVINGGFRTVTGVAVFGVIIPMYLYFLQLPSLRYANLDQLLPIFDHSVSELLKSSKEMTLSFLGFELLLIYYPFLKDPKKSKKWTHIAVAFTTFIYTMFMLCALVFFSQEQLQKIIWPTLYMLKVVQLPFVERIEYIAIASWLLVILPNICIGLWAASRTAKRIFSIKQRKVLLVFMGIVYFATGFLETRNQVDTLNVLTGQIGFYIVFIYIPLLYFIHLFYLKWKGRLSNE